MFYILIRDLHCSVVNPQSKYYCAAVILQRLVMVSSTIDGNCILYYLVIINCNIESKIGIMIQSNVVAQYCNHSKIFESLFVLLLQNIFI